MSNVKISANASGTGTVTIAAPNTNTDRTLTLPDATGTIITTAGGAAISGTTGSFTSTIGVGGATPAASGAGITFPATQSASSDANTLDDYEEGTWTPTDASGAGLSFTSPSGVYVKIGSQVWVTCEVTYPSTANASNAAIGGLPFTVGSLQGTNYFGAYLTSTNSSRTDLFTFNRSTTNILFRTNAAAGIANSSYSGKYLSINGTYSIL